MREEVTITPTSINNLVDTLMTISDTCKRLEASGFDGHTMYFEYQYVLGEEVNSSRPSCPVCKGFKSAGIYRGNEIKANFPNEYWRKSGVQIYPNVHVDRPELHGDCYCELPIIDVAGGCSKALVAEILAVIQ